MLRPDLTVSAVDKGEHHLLAHAASCTTGTSLIDAFAAVLVLLAPADVGLVSLYDAAHAEQPAIVLHRFPDAVRQEPSRLDGNAKHPAKLVRGNPFLAARHEVERLEPDIQLDMARFEDSPDLHGKRLAAVVALVDADAGA